MTRLSRHFCWRSFASRSPAAASPDPKDLAIPPQELSQARELVQQLGSEVYREREEAQAELAKMGRLARRRWSRPRHRPEPRGPVRAAPAAAQGRGRRPQGPARHVPRRRRRQVRPRPAGVEAVPQAVGHGQDGPRRCTSSCSRRRPTSNCSAPSTSRRRGRAGRRRPPARAVQRR